MKKITLTLITSLLFSGCATTKITPEARNQLNQTQIAIKSQPIAVLVNPCLLSNELGKDRILNQASQLSSEKFIQTLTQELNQNGVKISEVSSPFICGSMPEEQLKKYDYQVDQNTKRTTVNEYPFLNNKNVVMNSEQQKAILDFYQYTAKTSEISLNNALNKKKQLALPILDEKTKNTLKDWSKSNYIFVVSINGLNASVGSKFTSGALGLGVTLATMGAGAGLVSVYMPKEGQSYDVAVYDLDKKEFVWNKSSPLKGNIFSVKNHSLEAKNILDPLFESQKE